MISVYHLQQRNNILSSTLDLVIKTTTIIKGLSPTPFTKDMIYGNRNMKKSMRARVYHHIINTKKLRSKILG